MPTKKPSFKTPVSSKRKKVRLPGAIARDLGARIVSGHYKPGDVLDKEVDASERLQVSRGAYREAIRILNAKGLVYSRPKGGTTVSDPGTWHLLDPDVLLWIFEFDPDEKLLADLFKLRKIVEPEAAALAAAQRTQLHLDSMERSLAEMAKKTLTTEAGRLADRNFHATLLLASGNAFLVSLTTGITAAITWTTIFKKRKHGITRDPMPEHQRVYEAIKAADPAAAHKAMSKLIDLAFSDTKNVRSKNGAL